MTVVGFEKEVNDAFIFINDHGLGINFAYLISYIQVLKL